ncbi:hypothetical protein DFJ58DRAFT_915380 [Suillus subalutaceus]|uniref:uncharacterized protein n=1 Tax=Suillus subalutaceus TaxID=48586 RepID=UPI001B869824|nr:uncharacterized protein DFJ58DRAFT_915380 [Suillus subalutaceus]KAG1846390.1 hypothetical protein DFJ58DRAFT_915380 [Suillus subalutaceus]
MSPFTRHLTFQSNDLGKEVTIMFALVDDNMKSLYKDRFPVVWKVSKFGKSGAYRAQATYTNQLAFSKAQVTHWNFISAGTSVKVNVGQKTTLTEADDVFSFSSPQQGSSGFVQALNNTGVIQDIAVGFLNKGDLMPTPALYFDDVGDGSHVTAQFTPILRVYITSDYQETAIIRSAIETPVIWSQDLSGLAEHTNWNLTRDGVTGRYKIVRAS